MATATLPFDEDVFEPSSNETSDDLDDFCKDLEQEWDERHAQTTKFFRRESFSDKFGLLPIPPALTQLNNLKDDKMHIPFDDIFLAANALSPTPIESGGALVLESDHCCLFAGELNGHRILVQVLKKFRGVEDFFLHQIKMHKKYKMKGLATLLRYSCNTKHLILAYEHLDFGPLRNLIAVNQKLPKLNWAARVQIVLDVATVIHELHTTHKVAHNNITSQNIFLNRHYQCKLGDFGHDVSSTVEDFLDDIKGLGQIISELYFDHSLTSNDTRFDQMVSRLKGSSTDLSSYLNHRHHLLCDVPDDTLLKFLALSKFCLNSDLLVEAKEVYERISEFYEDQTKQSTVMV